MSAGNIGNIIFSLFLVLVLLSAALVIVLAGASLAGLFEFGVPSEQSNIHRALSTGELVSILLVGLAIAGASMFLLRRL